MIEGLITFISGFCLIMGSLLIISGGVGVLRFPDFYSRMHAAGVTETLAAVLIIAGLMLHAGWGIVVLFKLLLIILFILLTSPTASHALVKAAQHGGLQPRLVDDGIADDQLTEDKAANKKPEQQ